MTKPVITLINGSLGGSSGNTAAAILDRLAPLLDGRAEVPVLHLSERPEWSRVCRLLERSQGFVFTTGTYWDSWGSPMQQFLEAATELENGDVFLGKPAAVIVTMHSVGGKGVLSRLQGVLNNFGVMIPPMSGMVYSMANHLALQGAPNPFHADLWQLRDLEVISHNLLQAVQGGRDWRSWEVDSDDPMRRWI